MRVFFMLIIAMVFAGCGVEADLALNESESEITTPMDDGAKVLKVGEIEIDGIVFDQLVYDDGSDAAKALFDDVAHEADGLGVMQQALYAGNCWASRAGGEYRVEDGDRDYYAKFNVSAGERYYVYVSAALWAALRAAGKSLVYFREGNRVVVNLGSSGRLFYYSVWVRRTAC